MTNVLFYGGAQSIGQPVNPGDHFGYVLPLLNKLFAPLGSLLTFFAMVFIKATQRAGCAVTAAIARKVAGMKKYTAHEIGADVLHSRSNGTN